MLNVMTQVCDSFNGQTGLGVFMCSPVCCEMYIRNCFIGHHCEQAA